MSLRGLRKREILSGRHKTISRLFKRFQSLDHMTNLILSSKLCSTMPRSLTFHFAKIFKKRSMKIIFDVDVDSLIVCTCGCSNSFIIIIHTSCIIVIRCHIDIAYIDIIISWTMNYSPDKKHRSIFGFLFRTAGLLRPYVFHNMFPHVAFIQRRWYTTKVRAVRGERDCPEAIGKPKGTSEYAKVCLFPVC